LNKKLLDQYLLTNSSDLQIIPNNINDITNSNILSQQSFLSPTQSTPNNDSRLLSINSPNTSICSTNINQSAISPTHCGSFAMKQLFKLAGSNMHRYYSSII